MKTERLKLRRLQQEDSIEVCGMLQDPDVMYSWEKTFSNKEIEKYIDDQVHGYNINGFGIWAVIEIDTSIMVGLIGFICNHKYEIELDYMLKKSHWHKGFAVEGCKCCLKYGFKQKKFVNIFSTIRPNVNRLRKNVIILTCFSNRVPIFYITFFGGIWLYYVFL